jgi:glutathione peroxidase-family protein
MDAMAIFDHLSTLGGTALEPGVQWNFEKFLISPQGGVLARFRPTVEPESEELTGAIEAALPA